MCILSYCDYCVNYSSIDAGLPKNSSVSIDSKDNITRLHGVGLAIDLDVSKKKQNKLLLNNK